MPAVSRPQDNRSSLVTVAAEGVIAPARWPETAGLSPASGPLLPGNGGVALGVHMGDEVGRWVGDHLMPGACAEDRVATQPGPGALHLLACLGNRVRAADGGWLGIVSGKRGGLAPGYLAPSLLAVDAPDDRLEELCPGDRIIVETIGRGLCLPDHPDVKLSNLAPALLDILPLDSSAATLQVAVRAWLPSRAAGAGIGQDTWVGDIEIADESELPALPLRFGDLVGFTDLDSATARFHRAGHVSIGMVCHGPSQLDGHGIGVCVLLTGPSDQLTGTPGRTASLGDAMAEMAVQL